MQDEGSHFKVRAGQNLHAYLGKGSPTFSARIVFHAFPPESFCAFSCAIRWDDVTLNKATELDWPRLPASFPPCAGSSLRLSLLLSYQQGWVVSCLPSLVVVLEGLLLAIDLAQFV